MNRALRGRPELLALVRRVIVDTVAPTMALVTSHVSNVITGTAYRTALPDCSTYDSIRDTKYESLGRSSIMTLLSRPDINKGGTAYLNLHFNQTKILYSIFCCCV